MDFREEQKMNSPFIRMLFLIMALAVLTGFGILYYKQQQEAGFDPGMLIAPFMVLLSFGTAYYVIFMTRLDTAITGAGFTYRYRIFIGKEITIPFQEIISWRLREYTNIFEMGGIGYKRSLFRKRITIILNKSDVLELKMTDKRTMVVSTLSGYLLQSAMRKYIPEKEIH